MPTIRERFASLIGRSKQRYCFRSDDEGGHYIVPIEQRELFEYIKEEKYHLGQHNTEELRKKFGKYIVNENLETISFTDPKLLFGNKEGKLVKRKVLNAYN